jgi:hypothetical protein
MCFVFVTSVPCSIPKRISTLRGLCESFNRFFRDPTAPVQVTNVVSDNFVYFVEVNPILFTKKAESICNIFALPS